MEVLTKEDIKLIVKSLKDTKEFNLKMKNEYLTLEKETSVKLPFGAPKCTEIANHCETLIHKLDNMQKGVD